MAKIEMDISEFKLMEENKSLLEKALLREKELNTEIDKLNKEKIEVLKSNEKSVTVVNRTEKREHKMSSLPIPTLMLRLEELSRRARVDYQFIGHYVDSLFTTTTSETMAQETVTVRGLDEVKEEMKAEYRAEMDTEIAGKLDKYKKLSVDYTELKSSHKDIGKVLSIEEVLSEELRNKVTELEEELKSNKEKEEEQSEVYARELLEALKNESTSFWSAKSFIKDLKKKYIKKDTI